MLSNWACTTSSSVSVFHYALNLLILFERTKAAALVTPVAQLIRRDVNSVCGFYNGTDSTLSAWACASGVPCAINRSMSPDLVFCSPSGYTAVMTFYGSGSWSAQGCGSQEICCPSSAPYVYQYRFDNGLTIGQQCQASPGWTPLTTQASGYLVTFAEYQPPVVAFKTPSPTTVTQTSLLYVVPTTAGVPNAASSSPTSPPKADAITLGGLAGTIIGSVAGIAGVIVAIYYGKRAWRKRHGSGHFSGTNNGSQHIFIVSPEAVAQYLPAPLRREALRVTEA